MFALRLAGARAPIISRSFGTSATRFAAERSVLEGSLRDGLKTAMKAKDRAAVSTLKAIIADVTNVVKSGPNPNEHASQEQVITTIRKGIDKRAVAAETYAAGQPGAHEENFAALSNEITLLKTYLPAAPTPEAVQGYIDEIIAGLSDAERQSKAVTGTVMKALWERLGDARASVDKKDVAQRVTSALKP